MPAHGQSLKPYLLRAIHEWCVDQGLTPYLLVAVDASTRVPREFVKNGEIVLNLGLEATNQLQLGNEEVTFQGRFGGKIFPLLIPLARVAAIYARENGEGMAFEVVEAATASHTGATEQASTENAVAPEPTSERPSHKPPGDRPALTRVK
ncbi:MAG: ClpXP protease specificity-enhancing factor [Betaproteobacteria bacterium HGW-Betaproteobacteria-11]|nr:MAG: ClpXP protease specificity-enhancing factor [Betaproteobacteria bacterium HGW-Betaproteobacteria-11]